jgi:hypothetical protein
MNRPAGSLLRLDAGELRRILLLWACWSAAVLLLAAISARLPPESPGPWGASVPAPPLARWDSGWYASIARDGYRYDPAQPQNNIGFYPLYPLLTRWLVGLLGTPVFETGIGLSLACLLAALVLIGPLFKGLADGGLVLPGLAALLLFPGAFFFAAFYTESLFLLATAGAFWGARSGRWTAAGLGAAAAAMTRFNGFLILLPLAWLVWESRRTDPRWPRRQLPGALLALCGAAAFPVFLWVRWGDPLLYVRSKAEGWEKSASPFWGVIAEGRRAWSRLRDEGGHGRGFFLELACALLFLALTILLLRRRRIAEGIYCGATLLLYLSSGNLSGMVRFSLALFPCFLVLAELGRGRPAARFVYACAGAGLGAVLLHRFVHWFFVG